MGEGRLAMKTRVLVATSKPHGDAVIVPYRLIRGVHATFCHVPEGELLMPLVCWEVIGCSDTRGCPFALSGVDTRKSTTFFKVVEQAITPKELEDRFFASLQVQGWVENKEHDPPLLFWQQVAKYFASAIVRVASKFPVGDVISKQGCTFWSRKDPQRSARIIVRRAKLS